MLWQFYFLSFFSSCEKSFWSCLPHSLHPNLTELKKENSKNKVHKYQHLSLTSYPSIPILRGIFLSELAIDPWIGHWFNANYPGQLSLHLPLLAFCSGDGDGGGISVDALACWLFQNICNVPRHVPSKGCSEILEQTRSITQLTTDPQLSYRHAVRGTRKGQWENAQHTPRRAR